MDSSFIATESSASRYSASETEWAGSESSGGSGPALVADDGRAWVSDYGGERARDVVAAIRHINSVCGAPTEHSSRSVAPSEMVDSRKKVESWVRGGLAPIMPDVTVTVVEDEEPAKKKPMRPLEDGEDMVAWFLTCRHAERPKEKKDDGRLREMVKAGWRRAPVRSWSGGGGAPMVAAKEIDWGRRGPGVMICRVVDKVLPKSR
jgi:hypothetical protein